MLFWLWLSWNEGSDYMRPIYTQTGMHMTQTSLIKFAWDRSESMKWLRETGMTVDQWDFRLVQSVYMRLVWSLFMFTWSSTILSLKIQRVRFRFSPKCSKATLVYVWNKTSDRSKLCSCLHGSPVWFQTDLNHPLQLSSWNESNWFGMIFHAGFMQTEANTSMETRVSYDQGLHVNVPREKIQILYGYMYVKYATTL